MPSVEMLPSGRFRGVARVKEMRDAQVFDRRDDAASWAEKVEERMRKGKWTPPPKKQAGELRAEGITVKQACEAYLLSEEFRSLAATTKANEPSKQKAVIRLLGSTLLTELTPDHVREFVGTRREEKPSRAGKAPTMSAHGVRLEVAALSSVCNYAITRKWLAVNPCRGVRRPTGDRRTRRLTDEEIGKVLDAMMDVDDEHEAGFVFFRLLFSTVCRPGELACARREWLREDPPQIFLPRTKNEDERTIILTVNNFKMLQDFIARQPADCPYLFGTRKRDGKNWSPYNYRVVWDKALAASGLRGKGIVPYLARHEGVSRLFERTSLSDGQIAGISGHRSAQALWHYKHLRNEHQRPVMNALDAMVGQAVNRSISHLAPYEALGPGEMMKPIYDKPRGDEAEP